MSRQARLDTDADEREPAGAAHVAADVELLVAELHAGLLVRRARDAGCDSDIAMSR